MENKQLEMEAMQKAVQDLKTAIGKVIVGQRYLTERLVIGLLSNGHVLLEGVPGLAKTLSVKSLAACLIVKFARLQFTPDMLPADVIGTQIYNPQSGGFTTRKGPIFANLVLADEINRATPKTQSALLEAMQEYQVTVGGVRHQLERPLFVLSCVANGAGSPAGTSGGRGDDWTVWFGGAREAGGDLLVVADVDLAFGRQRRVRAAVERLAAQEWRGLARHADGHQ